MHVSSPSSPALPLVSLHRLRGLAALFVVTGHAFGITGLSPAKEILEPVYLLIASATSLFVLLAGILFQMKTAPRLISGQVTARDVLRKRWKELAPLYLIIGTPLAVILTYNVTRLKGANPVHLFPATMLSGGMSYSYWYIPFFLALMAVIPLHLWFLRRHKHVQVVLIAVGLIFSAFLHRPINDVFHATPQSLVYYLPVFWIGMLAGENFSALLAWLKGKELAFLGLTLAIVYLQIGVGQREVYLHPIGENFGTIDLYLLQKVALAAALISILHRSAHLEMPFFDWCGKHSLAIFFLHSPMLIFLLSMKSVTGIYVPEIVLCTALLLFLSVAYDGCIKRVVRQVRHSRAARRAASGQR